MMSFPAFTALSSGGFGGDFRGCFAVLLDVSLDV